MIWIQKNSGHHLLPSTEKKKKPKQVSNKFKTSVSTSIRECSKVSPWSAAGGRWGGKWAVWVQGYWLSVLRRAGRWTAAPRPELRPRSVSAARWVDPRAACLAPGRAVPEQKRDRYIMIADVIDILENAGKTPSDFRLQALQQAVEQKFLTSKQNCWTSCRTLFRSLLSCSRSSTVVAYLLWKSNPIGME